MIFGRVSRGVVPAFCVGLFLLPSTVRASLLLSLSLFSFRCTPCVFCEPVNNRVSICLGAPVIRTLDAAHVFNQLLLMHYAL